MKYRLHLSYLLIAIFCLLLGVVPAVLPHPERNIPVPPEIQRLEC